MSVICHFYVDGDEVHHRTMPFAPRVGDHVTFDDGDLWVIESVCISIPEGRGHRVQVVLVDES